MLYESAAYGLGVRFLEVIQLYRYARAKFLIGSAERRAIASVEVELGGGVAGLSVRDKAIPEGGHLVEIEMLLREPGDFDTLPIVLCLVPASPVGAWTDENVRFAFTLLEAANFQHELDDRAGNPCAAEFMRCLANAPEGRVLEIGSRARSGATHREMFGEREYVGIDVMAGEGVTLVGDAHALSGLLEPASIDIVFSASVFEHLLMPWKVALELNRVLKTGGFGLIVTHQSCGMHDRPWDFWRFSETAWAGLFNARTGFEILQTHLGSPVYVVPFLRRTHFAGFEASSGYYESTVLFRKTHDADPLLVWDVRVGDVVDTTYPK